MSSAAMPRAQELTRLALGGSAGDQRQHSGWRGSGSKEL